MRGRFDSNHKPFMLKDVGARHGGDWHLPHKSFDAFSERVGAISR